MSHLEGISLVLIEGEIQFYILLSHITGKQRIYFS